MDQESALLASINAKLEETIEKMRWKNQKSKIKTLFPGKIKNQNQPSSQEKSKIKTNPLSRRAKVEEMRPRPGLATLFDMGCGFTEFLSNVFHNLPLPQVFNLVFVFSDL